MTTDPFHPQKRPSRLGSVGHMEKLEASTLDALDAICRLRRFEPGQTVVLDGERPEFIGCVRSGYLRMQKTLADGRQHMVGLLVEGDMFGHMFNGPIKFALEAATEAEIWAFQRAPFEDLLLHAPDLERAVILNILNELDRARDWMVILGNNRVTGRIAGFLLVLCNRFFGVDHLLRIGSGSVDVKVPIGRHDLANLLGTRPESLSRAFHALADSGAIELLKPDLIRIRDVSALAAEAGEDAMDENAHLRGLLQLLKKRA